MVERVPPPPNPAIAVAASALRAQQQRMRVIAENVANANTPNYAPHDLKAFTFAAALKAQSGPAMGMTPVATAVTSAGHMEGKERGPTGPWKPEDAPDSEARLDGNQVVLEDEMMKMTTSKLDYDTAVSFYQQSLGLLKMSIRRPGG